MSPAKKPSKKDLVEINKHELEQLRYELNWRKQHLENAHARERQLEDAKNEYEKRERKLRDEVDTLKAANNLLVEENQALRSAAGVTPKPLSDHDFEVAISFAFGGRGYSHSEDILNHNWLVAMKLGLFEMPHASLPEGERALRAAVRHGVLVELVRRGILPAQRPLKPPAPVAEPRVDDLPHLALGLATAMERLLNDLAEEAGADEYNQAERAMAAFEYWAKERPPISGNVDATIDRWVEKARQAKKAQQATTTEPTA